MAFASFSWAGRRSGRCLVRIPIGTALADRPGRQQRESAVALPLRIFKVPKEETKTRMNWWSEGLAVLAGADPLPGCCR